MLVEDHAVLECLVGQSIMAHRYCLRRVRKSGLNILLSGQIRSLGLRQYTPRWWTIKAASGHTKFVGEIPDIWRCPLAIFIVPRMTPKCDIDLKEGHPSNFQNRCRTWGCISTSGVI